jgi:predicted lipoprotein with Yx(FWY)xxD motif
MTVMRTSVGYVLGEANGQVLYTYAHDKKGGLPTCTSSSCTAQWPPATGTPRETDGFHFPGTFGVVKGAGGVEQITYNGYPLYLYKGAKPHIASGNGVGGVWHVVPLSAADIG